MTLRFSLVFFNYFKYYTKYNERYGRCYHCIILETVAEHFFAVQLLGLSFLVRHSYFFSCIYLVIYLSFVCICQLINVPSSTEFSFVVKQIRKCTYTVTIGNYITNGPQWFFSYSRCFSRQTMLENFFSRGNCKQKKTTTHPHLLAPNPA